MRALAGPAMLVVIVGGFAVSRYVHRSDAPSRDFTELEFSAAGATQPGSCYSLSTVLIANRPINGNAARTWTRNGENSWTLTLDDVAQGYNGPERFFQKFTFEKRGEQVYLTAVEASKNIPAEIGENTDMLLTAPNERHSTPIDRCLAPGAAGYLFTPRR